LILSCLVLIQLASAGVIYTRWGRTVCPLGTDVLYKGFSAKGHYWHSGSGANYVCAHSNPVFGDGAVPGDQATSAWIYGIEYEFNSGYTNNKPFSYANNNGADLQDNDAPCVVCYNSVASAHHMVVGRPDCPSPDMNLEYSGYLASERHIHYKGEFVCLDLVPEVRQGGQANDNGGLFYPVQAGCGSLPCPPYTQGLELTCAVCSI